MWYPCLHAIRRLRELLAMLDYRLCDDHGLKAFDKEDEAVSWVVQWLISNRRTIASDLRWW